MPTDTKMRSLKVQCYSGYKADEKPVSFVLDSNRLNVEKIIDQWRGPEFQYFKVLADDGKAYLLRHDEENNEWVLEKVYE